MQISQDINLPEKVWKFGYGSNMSPSFMKNKKNIHVFLCKPAILKGYKLIFSEGLSFTEPGFANLLKTNDEEETHGVLSLMTKESALSLDKQESIYIVKKETVLCYDGELVEAELYVYNKESPAMFVPSYRYMQILIKGALEVGLKDYYVEKLKSIKTYQPNQETLEKRKFLPSKEKLKMISLSDFSKNNGENNSETWTSVMGYIFKADPKYIMWFIPKDWKGMEISPRILAHFRGTAWDTKNSFNYPKIKELSNDDLEYLYQNIDRCLHFYGIDNLLGFLKEFDEAQ